MRPPILGILLLGTLFIGGLLSSGPPAASQTPQEKASFYTVDHYDPARDPADDLGMTVGRATAEGKRILLQVGGDWCGWCKRLDLFIADHQAIWNQVEADFLIMKVTMDRENPNEAFLSQYPTIPGYPHIYVLESDGTFLYSKNTVELEEGSTYNEEAILTFLDEWKPGCSG